MKETDSRSDKTEENAGSGWDHPVLPFFAAFYQIHQFQYDKHAQKHTQQTGFKTRLTRVNKTHRCGFLGLFIIKSVILLA